MIIYIIAFIILAEALYSIQKSRIEIRSNNRPRYVHYNRKGQLDWPIPSEN